MERAAWLSRLLTGISLALSLAALVACSSSSEEHPRCAQCGMYADAAPQWLATARDSGGALLQFDGPKCMLRYAAGAGAGRGLQLSVTEYYSQTTKPVEALLFVRGSDLRSPMGRDLVPVEGRDAANDFARDHGGDVLTFAEITPAVLAGLD